MNRQFAIDVRHGLSQSPKSLSSKYFYDERGSTLFSEIMKLPEYYLTNAEFEIFQNQGVDLIQTLGIKKRNYFELIELGAGDGYKTIELLKVLDHENFKYQYHPIDISQKALDQIESAINKQFPDKKISTKKGDYFQMLTELKSSPYPKIVLFLGSNIGNMEDAMANTFLKKLSESLSEGDKLILGTDVKKSKDIILPAYNDSQGVTRDFNLNLLERINRELDANFDITQFVHFPEYDESEGVARSFIRSKISQDVTIKAINLSVKFEIGEYIKTEISRKYDDETLDTICHDTGLKIIGKLMDSRQYFADFILEKQN
ncbi:MAG: L-histidine N(alpha)-methyltransferase [Saprospiraceae bacterium]|nr:L-histidine N(alpha)-methyltransferase [Saprospiraceae bacterium]